MATDTMKESDARVPYSPPVLEPLGTWQAVTLQQSIPIFP